MDTTGNIEGIRVRSIHEDKLLSISDIGFKPIQDSFSNSIIPQVLELITNSPLPTGTPEHGGKGGSAHSALEEEGDRGKKFPSCAIY